MGIGRVTDSLLGEASELCVVVADGVGEGLNGRTEGGEFVGYRGDRPVRSSAAVLLDHGAECWVSVEGGAGGAGALGDAYECDGVAVAGEVDASAFDLVQGRGHPVWASVSAMSDMPQPCSFGGVVELTPDALLGEPPAEVGEQELRRPPVAGVRYRPAVGAKQDDPVDHLKDLGIEGNHSFGGEFPERDLQPGTVVADLVTQSSSRSSSSPIRNPQARCRRNPSAASSLSGCSVSVAVNRRSASIGR